MQRAIEVADGVLMLPLRTPTLPPATTTNTLIVGHSRLAVIEPATPHPDQQRRLDRTLDELAADGREVVAVLITHHHADHTGYAPALRDRLGVPMYAHELTADRVDFDVDVTLDDGGVVELGDGFELRTVLTPGHAPGHLVYLEPRTRVAHAGDMLAGEGWIMIDPEDDGNMTEYLESLERMRGLADVTVPAHGPVLDDPEAVISRYVEHRLERERKVIDAITGGASIFDDALAVSYADTPRALWPLAARSLEAHLRRLEHAGRIRRKASQIILS